ncbi:hypothetical protein HMPREF9374_2031 [Desmospora sp. 8437]|nr:hypothetical protein HMPREF9374_2031 [Desmospora sp. 8437]
MMVMLRQAIRACLFCWFSVVEGAVDFSGGRLCYNKEQFHEDGQ